MAEEPVDLSRMTDIFGDDTEFLNELYTTYLDEGELGVVELGAAIEGGDSGKSSEISHAIKGASANVGATRVQEIAGKMEVQGNDGDVADLADSWPTLRTEFDAAKKFLHDFLATLSTS